MKSEFTSKRQRQLTEQLKSLEPIFVVCGFAGRKCVLKETLPAKTRAEAKKVALFLAKQNGIAPVRLLARRVSAVAIAQSIGGVGSLVTASASQLTRYPISGSATGHHLATESARAG